MCKLKLPLKPLTAWMQQEVGGVLLVEDDSDVVHAYHVLADDTTPKDCMEHMIKIVARSNDVTVVEEVDLPDGPSGGGGAILVILSKNKSLVRC
nr:hypothetical protein CFP56_25831 [Quercus suber]